jgi:hypothetical protein
MKIGDQQDNFREISMEVGERILIETPQGLIDVIVAMNGQQTRTLTYTDSGEGIKAKENSILISTT